MDALNRDNKALQTLGLRLVQWLCIIVLALLEQIRSLREDKALRCTWT